MDIESDSATTSKKGMSGDKLGLKSSNLASEDDNGDVVDENRNGEGSDRECLFRLSLGRPESEDYHTCEVSWPCEEARRYGQHQLAAMAIADLLNGEDIFGDDDDDDDVANTWHIRQTAESQVDSYLYGILWNLQTYQVRELGMAASIYIESSIFSHIFCRMESVLTTHTTMASERAQVQRMW